MNELNQFNVGGSHESNPYSGIPLGTDQNGVPNTVEQGETMQNDFVFSDRIVLRPDVISQVGLPKTLANKTIAEATKIIDKQFKDRTSKIDKSTRDAMYDRIAQAQEMIKAEEQAKIAAAQEMNSTEVPDMMNGQIPQGMDQFMQPEAGMEQLPMENQDGRIQSGMQDLGQPMFKYGGKMNKYQGGGFMNFMSNNSEMIGGVGTAVGGISGGSYAKQMKKNEEAGFVDNKLAKDQANEQMIEGTLDSVSSAFGPFGQAFRGIQKMGKGIGDSIGGDAGAAISGIFSPEAATMSNLTNPDLNFGQKMLGTIPGVGGVIASRAAKKRAAKEAENRERKEFYDTHIGSLSNNDDTKVFAYGGKVNKFEGGGPFKYDRNNIEHVKGLQSWGNKNKPGWLNANTNPKYKNLSGILPETHADYGIHGIATDTLPISEYEAYMNSQQSTSTSQPQQETWTPEGDVILGNMNRYNSNEFVGPANYNQDSITGGTHFGRKINPHINTTNNSENQTTSQNKNYGNLARYAPMLMNAFQLNTLGKPQVNRLQRLNNQYQRQFLDEAAYQNIAREQASAARNAIGRSGATTSQMIGAQLGTQLGASKAIADSYDQIRKHNIGENRLRQQTQFGNNQFNIQQDNLEQDINDRNKGNWQTQRSKLLGQLGTDFGNVGKEETYKDMAIAATGYDWMGKYMQNNPNATKAEVEKAYKKANPKATKKEIDDAYNKAKERGKLAANEDLKKYLEDNNLQYAMEELYGANSNRLGGTLNRKLR